MDDIMHGNDGWILVDYTWGPETGIGKFTYEREVIKEEKTVKEVVVRSKNQPSLPTHEGWRR